MRSGNRNGTARTDGGRTRPNRPLDAVRFPIDDLPRRTAPYLNSAGTHIAVPTGQAHVLALRCRRPPLRPGDHTCNAWAKRRGLPHTICHPATAHASRCLTATIGLRRCTLNTTTGERVLKSEPVGLSTHVGPFGQTIVGHHCGQLLTHAWPCGQTLSPVSPSTGDTRLTLRSGSISSRHVSNRRRLTLRSSSVSSRLVCHTSTHATLR